MAIKPAHEHAITAVKLTIKRLKARKSKIEEELQAAEAYLAHLEARS